MFIHRRQCQSVSVQRVEHKIIQKRNTTLLLNAELKRNVPVLCDFAPRIQKTLHRERDGAGLVLAAKGVIQFQLLLLVENAERAGLTAAEMERS